MAQRELTILAEDVASGAMLIERQRELMRWLCARGYFDLAEDAAAVLATLHSMQADHIELKVPSGLRVSLRFSRGGVMAETT